jgi:hypothetical protein
MYWLQQNHAYGLSQRLEKLGFWRFCFGRGPSFPPLDAAVERRLRERFLPEVEAVEELTNRDLSAWKPSSPERAERIAATV